MFSYFGSKSKISQCYPSPLYNTVIEPFAGAANYSLRRCPDKSVWINDLNPDIYRLWLYLQRITTEEIESIPEMVLGDDIREMDISEDMRLLLGFVVVRGVATPHNIYSSQSVWGNSVGQTKKRLLKYHQLIKHWKITNLDYREIPNIEATWFIDSPYQYGGEHYPMSSKMLDFSELAEWCNTRKGQVIVCENTKADWMDFTPLRKMHGSKHTTTEAMWTNIPHPTQMPMFSSGNFT